MSHTSEDLGAALMAWYADCIQRFPDGLVTQAQAAVMLGVSRVAVNRLITRGHLKAVYFPKPPDVEGLEVGYDDPTWKKLVTWFDGLVDPKVFPKAVYVSFADVVRLWRGGNIGEKCRLNWMEILAKFTLPPSPEDRAVQQYADRAHAEVRQQRDETREGG